MRYNGTADQTLDHVWVRGPIYWTSAARLTITNSVMDARTTADPTVYKGTTGIWIAGQEGFGVVQGNGAGPVTVIDSTVIGTANNTQKGAPVNGFKSMTLLRDDLSGFPQGADPGTGSTITQVWFHNIRQTGNAHLDGVFLEGSNITVQQCYIDGSAGNGAGTTAAIFSQAPAGGGIKLYANYIGMWGALGTSIFNQASPSTDIINNEFANGLGYSGYVPTWPVPTLGTTSGNRHTDGSVVAVTADPNGIKVLH
jgi:hypothetical protein